MKKPFIIVALYALILVGGSSTASAQMPPTLTAANSENAAFFENAVIYNNEPVYTRINNVNISNPPKGCMQLAGSTGSGSCSNTALYRNFLTSEWINNTTLQTSISNPKDYPIGKYEGYIAYPGGQPIKTGLFTLRDAPSKYQWTCVVPGPTIVNTSGYTCNSSNLGERRKINGYDCSCDAMNTPIVYKPINATVTYSGLPYRGAAVPNGGTISIPAGKKGVLTWDSNGGTDCTLDGDAVPASGDTDLSEFNPGTYTFACNGMRTFTFKVEAGTPTITPTSNGYQWTCVVPGPTPAPDMSAYACNSTNVGNSRKINGFDCSCGAVSASTPTPTPTQVPVPTESGYQWTCVVPGPTTVDTSKYACNNINVGSSLLIDGFYCSCGGNPSSGSYNPSVQNSSSIPNSSTIPASNTLSNELGNLSSLSSETDRTTLISTIEKLTKLIELLLQQLTLGSGGTTQDKVQNQVKKTITYQWSCTVTEGPEYPEPKPPAVCDNVKDRYSLSEPGYEYSCTCKSRTSTIKTPTPTTTKVTAGAGPVFNLNLSNNSGDQTRTYAKVRWYSTNSNPADSNYPVSCLASDDWSGSKLVPISGDATTIRSELIQRDPLKTKKLTLTCTDANGYRSSRSVSINSVKSFDDANIVTAAAPKLELRVNNSSGPLQATENQPLNGTFSANVDLIGCRPGPGFAQYQPNTTLTMQSPRTGTIDKALAIKGDRDYDLNCRYKDKYGRESILWSNNVRVSASAASVPNVSVSTSNAPAVKKCELTVSPKLVPKNGGVIVTYDTTGYSKSVLSSINVKNQSVYSNQTIDSSTVPAGSISLSSLSETAAFGLRCSPTTLNNTSGNTLTLSSAKVEGSNDSGYSFSMESAGIKLHNNNQ